MSQWNITESAQTTKCRVICWELKGFPKSMSWIHVNEIYSPEIRYVRVSGVNSHSVDWLGSGETREGRVRAERL